MPGVLLGLSTEYEQNALSPMSRNGITVGDITISIRMSVHCQTNESIYVSWKGLCGERRAECKRKQTERPSWPSWSGTAMGMKWLAWGWRDDAKGRQALSPGAEGSMCTSAGENRLGPPLRPVGLEFTGRGRRGGRAGRGILRNLHLRTLFFLCPSSLPVDAFLIADTKKIHA